MIPGGGVVIGQDEAMRESFRLDADIVFDVLSGSGVGAEGREKVVQEIHYKRVCRMRSAGHDQG